MKAALILALALAAAIPAQDGKKAEPKAPPPKVSLPPVVIKPPVNDALNLCRAACARSRFLCLDQNDAETCDPIWNQCRADCVKANP